MYNKYTSEVDSNDVLASVAADTQLSTPCWSNPSQLINFIRTQRKTHKHKHTEFPPSPSTVHYKCHLSTFTLEETLDAEVGDCEAQHGQFVQLGDDIRGERQQAGQPVQLSIQPVPVPLGRVGFLTGRRRLPDDETGRGETDRRGRMCV